MIKIKENTTIVSVSDLRDKLDEIIKLSKQGRVVLAKHHKPIAFIVDSDKYENMEQAQEDLEDLLLALEAHKRDGETSLDEYIKFEDV